jgi:hypothetical protein
MKTITDEEADQWVAQQTPEGLRKVFQEYHALRQGLCYQVLLVATGADDWVDRAIAAAYRIKKSEGALRRLVYEVENASAKARNDVQETTCTNCMGRGQVGDDSCCICRGTGLRQLS